MSEEVLYEVDGHVAIITLNRPEKHNAMNPDLIKLLRETFNKANHDRNIRSVVLTGAGDRDSLIILASCILVNFIFLLNSTV